ncbi:ribbon-helix-helix domain-containing protein [Halalkalibacter oceani]|uniref:ribbon-helix-helix domain-containing protein n=1 Tax=Halalkalibacter oceani TaxID=1653776 RepID=UPI003396CA9E
MGIRDLKHRRPLSSTLRNDLFEYLDQVHRETGMPKTRLLDRAVERYLNDEYSEIVEAMKNIKQNKND